jgi:hypothetical protein
VVEQTTVNRPVGGSSPSWGAEGMKYDWNDRAAKKQAARDKDAEDIKNGVPVSEVRRRNFIFSGMEIEVKDSSPIILVIRSLPD